MSDCEPSRPFPPRPIGVTRPDALPAALPQVPPRKPETVIERKQDVVAKVKNGDQGDCDGDGVVKIVTDVEQFT
ncbi:MAG: hypothetical protein AAGJ83_01790, partial [Planctomycetota bacterium]